MNQGPAVRITAAASKPNLNEVIKMKLVVKRIETHQPDWYETPLSLDGGHGDDYVEHRCKVTIVCFCKVDGKDTAVEHNYPEALVTLKSDSPAKECSNIVLIFNLVDTQGTLVAR